MRKVIVGILGVVVFSLLGSGVALAGNPHNGDNALDDICAGCHRAHNALGPRLIVNNTLYNLCVSCHDGTGSKLDVLDGSLLTAANGSPVAGSPRLNGGGFVNVVGDVATSSHNATGNSAWGYTVAWGATGPTGTSGPVSGMTSLTCGSCHDVHGTTMYRLLKYSIGGSTGASAISVYPGDTYDSSPSYSYQSYVAVPVGGVPTAPYRTDINNRQGISTFCGSCHVSYLVRATNSGTSSLGANNTYRHRVDMDWNGGSGSASTIAYGAEGYSPAVNPRPDRNGVSAEKIPLAFDVNDGAVSSYPTRVTCLTCHFAHGTSTTGEGAYSGMTGQYLPSSDTSLVRSKGRGICQTCHQRGQ